MPSVCGLSRENRFRLMPKLAALSAIFQFGKIGIRRKHPSSSQAFFVYVVLRVKDSGQNNGEVRRILRGLELPFQVPWKNQEILRKNEAKARVSHSGWTDGGAIPPQP